MTTQRQVRAAFWQAHKGLVPRKKIRDYAGTGTMYPTDTRVAFSDFVDRLSKDGSIDEALASRVTLD